MSIAQVTTIPLAKLTASSLNVRKTGGQNVSDLAASILAHGLLQNLTVVKGKAGKFEVVAGGRRLRALQMLVKGKQLPADFAPECKVIDAQLAAETSLAENVVREAMHPADQFDAFQALAAAGESAVDIAAHFGVTERVVEQRLKLAKVSPRLIADYRAGKMDLEKLQAFTITDDQDLQEKVWDDLSDYESAADIRSTLTAHEVDASEDCYARFVGRAAYEEAGGRVRNDLFGETVYFDDAELLRTLATRKLDAAVEQVKAEGWSWVSVSTARNAVSLYRFERQEPKLRTTTVDEDRELASLEDREAEIRQQWQDLPEEDEPGYDPGAYSAIEDQLEAVKARVRDITADRQVWPKKAFKEAGAVVELTPSGALVVHRGMVKPADAKKEQKAREVEEAAAAGAPPEPAAGEVSEAVTLQLTAHRTAAMQYLLTGNAHVALVVLTHALLKDTFGPGFTTAEKLGDYRAGRSYQRYHGVADDFEPVVLLEAARTALEARIPDDEFTWLLSLPNDEVLQVLAVCVACAFNATHGKGGGQILEKRQLVDQVAGALGLKMEKFWQPTVANYLGAVPKALVIEAVTESLNETAAAPLASMKKNDAAAAAEDLLDGSGWLPPAIRPFAKAVPQERAADTESVQAVQHIQDLLDAKRERARRAKA